MARPALSATRALELLSFLAANPDPDGYTMSELARRLGVNTASMHSVLNALLAGGYVVREPNRKRYCLGASLVAVGDAALDQQPAVRRAREQCIILAEQLQLECLAGVITGGEILFVGEAGRPERLHRRPRVGQRLPFMPPLAILAASHLRAAELEAWLDRLGPLAAESDREAYRKAAVSARARGYEIGLETPTRDLIGLLMLELAEDPRSGTLRAKLAELVIKLSQEQHQLVDPEPGESYLVNHISASIFGPDRRQVAGLTLLGFDQPLGADEIEQYTRTIVRTCTAITVATNGRPPLDL